MSPKPVRTKFKNKVKGLAKLQRSVRPDRRGETPGRPAGLILTRPEELTVEDDPELSELQICDYGPEAHRVFSVKRLKKLREPEEDVAVRWINLNVPHEPTLKALGKRFGLHPLSLEDAMHRPQRIRLDEFSGADFMVLRMLTQDGERLLAEQISVFVGPNWVITVQERPGDVWDPVRHRISREGTRLRKGGVGTLIHALIDCIIDHCFPLVDTYGEALEALETEAFESRDFEGLTVHLHLQRREEALIRRMLWPMKPLLTQLKGRPWQEGPLEAYMQDAAEHLDQLIEQLDLDRETVDNLVAFLAQRRAEHLNDAMKWLAVLSSLFIPPTFIAGVFGMNFDHLPGSKAPWGFWMMMGVSMVTMVAMVWLLRRRRWI